MPLGDGGPNIETLPRQGYRFAARVTAPFEESITSGSAVAVLGHKPGLEAEERAGNQACGVVIDSTMDEAFEEPKI